MTTQRGAETFHVSESALDAAALLARDRVCLVLHTSDTVIVVPIERNARVVVGRGPPSDHIIEDESLSRVHASFERVEEGIWVEDLGSTNGTTVNGKPIGRALANRGDEVAMGAVIAVVQGPARLAAPVAALLSHDGLRSFLNDEVQRAAHFGRKLGLVEVDLIGSARDEPALAFARLEGLLRPVDRAAWYSRHTLEIVAPELDQPGLRTLAQRIQQQLGADRVRIGAAVFPDRSTTLDGLIDAARQALHSARERDRIEILGDLARVVRSAGTEAAARTADEPVIVSRATREVFDLARRLASASIPVLITGETGTGKEIVARMLHRAGPRADAPLYAVNCAAIPAQLVEATLFGHEKGAFTGADQSSKGVLEAAEGGTVLLDEIGELSPPAQAALLRAVETKRISRVGSRREIEVDVRIVAATHRDLEEMCRDGGFRLDLLFRLNAMTLHLPPLRERTEEILPLADAFLRSTRASSGASAFAISPEAARRLITYSWPGNVRELKNAIERAAALATGEVIDAGDLPNRVRAGSELAPAQGEPSVAGPRAASPLSAAASYKDRVRQFESSTILDALRASGGNQTVAARELRIPLRTLVKKIRALGLRRHGFALAPDDNES